MIDPGPGPQPQLRRRHGRGRIFEAIRPQHGPGGGVQRYAEAAGGQSGKTSECGHVLYVRHECIAQTDVLGQRASERGFRHMPRNMLRCAALRPSADSCDGARDAFVRPLLIVAS